MIDKVYISLLKTDTDAALDYAIETHMSGEDILECLLAMGADNPKSIFHDDYIMLKEEENL